MEAMQSHIISLLVKYLDNHKCMSFYGDYVRWAGNEGQESMQEGETAQRTYIISNEMFTKCRGGVKFVE